MYRELTEQLQEKSASVTVLLGGRQVGKTTLLKNCFPDAAYINLELAQYIDIFNSRDLKRITEIIQLTHGAQKNIWILDEVQRLDDPGLVAKIIHDERPDIRLIISGSSALEIANKASESLAGRKRTITLYPLTLKEKLIQTGRMPQSRSQHLNFASTPSSQFSVELEECMQYGLYPHLLSMQANKEKEAFLLELADSLLLKDVYYLNLVKNTKNLLALLKLLAYQIGSQVNMTELSSRIGISRQTVVDYIEILKKTFIIFTLPPYTKKRRDEIGKTEKVYFWDLGIRNALINDFSPVSFRRDYGNIFENFVITEIEKLNDYYTERYSMYYWRTKWGSEVDLILVKDGLHKAVEIKTRKGKITTAFTATYPNTEEYIITKENVTGLLL